MIPSSHSQNSSASGRNLFEWNSRKRWGGEEEEKGRPPTLQAGTATKDRILQSHKIMVQFLVIPPSFENKIFNAIELTGPGYPDLGLHL